MRARAVAVKICGDADDSFDAIELAVAAETGEICRGDDARKPFERFLSELATLAADDGKSGAKKKAAAPRRSSRRGRGATVAEEPEDDEIEAASDDDRDKWDVDDDDAAAAAARESGGEEEDDDDDENADDKRFLLVERVRKHRARYKTADAAATGAAKAAESTLSKSRDKRSSLNYLLRQMEDCEKERDAVEDGGEGGDDPAYDANQCPICAAPRGRARSDDPARGRGVAAVPPRRAFQGTRTIRRDAAATRLSRHSDDPPRRRRDAPFEALGRSAAASPRRALPPRPRHP